MLSISVLCLPPSRVDPKVLGLDVLIYRSQLGGSWTTQFIEPSDPAVSMPLLRNSLR